ncbi:hypothetical protein TRVL_00954 [Trypanosoma vivax]|uniref:PPIase cyclophilin-type domain-containing protein n=1 Tax=Trypanosoma vivax (strain Y486) TaxID=1055687 RepID=G0U1M4_TRYVY|nr:hypothetical protein TRVL_00954 [Trypanosoma vivax]CCC49981.1 conserved hypothetical protein [Trypanosoma vivax Y486]
MYGKSLLRREPLGVPHRGITLTHPSNPVIFMDITIPCHKETGAENAEHEGLTSRFMFELFADLAPTLAANVYGLCIGSCSRLVEHRPQAAGYRGTLLHDTLVGQYLIGGDVMGGSGSGFFSAVGERQGPLQIPINELDALTRTAPERCTQTQGLYMQYWNHSAAAKETAEPPKVASTFRMDIEEREAADKMPDNGILIGRMVYHDEEERSAAKRDLKELTKAVFHAKRATPSRQNLLFPVITSCGEM